MQKNLINSLRILPSLRLVMTPRIMPMRMIRLSPMLQKASSGVKVTPKIAKLQQRFQENNGKPVFLKGGSMDNILYKLTLVLCLVGVLGDAWLWFGYILA